ncbi:unnamed protein product, partial [Hermetia illucens]
YPDLNNTSYPNLAKTVFVIFMIFVPILLLNMLIAMMGNTYAHVIEQSEKEWMKQWAKIVVTLERAIPQADAQKYLEAYSIPLGPSDDSGFEQRGVMVIKSKSKTRAKQRKGAVSNWKRVGRVTLSALKKRGMTGEELRRIMWGRASITSPTKVSKKKLKDPYNIFCGTNNAIGTAIDVMSFTHDIVLCAENPEQEQNINNSKPAANIAIGKPVINTTVNRTSSSVIDPLRELVLMSETGTSTDTNYLNSVQQLANQASILVQAVPAIPDICNSSSTKATSPKHTQLQTGTEITNMSSIFQDPKDIIDPKKEKAFLKQLEVLEDTEDSDGFIERPILGKISLIRRAKSAVTRTSFAKKANNQHPLLNLAWDQQRNGPEEGTADVRACIQLDGESNKEGRDTFVTTEPSEPVAVSDVRRKVEQLHLKERQSQPSECKVSKTNRVRGNKNRISPDNIEKKAASKRGKSAPNQFKCTRNSPPDPLEPWSTRELTNINKILES